MELNPIFRLELIQCRRNYLLPILFLGGCIMAASYFILPMVLPSLSPLGGFYWILPLINIVLNLFPIFIVAWVSLKFAAQQVDEDLILSTPLSARQILSGKIQTALALYGCFLIPIIPQWIWYLLFQESGYCILIGVLFGVIRIVCWTMIGLGFMAGARTSVLRGILIAWAALFMLATYWSTYTISQMTMNYLLNSRTDSDSSLLREVIWRLSTISGVIPTLLMMVIGTAMFWMGLHLFRRSESLKKALFRVLVFAVISSVVMISLSIFYSLATLHTIFFFSTLFLSILWLLLVFPPVLAMYTVLLYDRRYKVPAD